MLRSIATLILILHVSAFGQGTPVALDLAVEAAGPYDTANWATRVNNANLIDLLSTNSISSPVLAPGNPLGWALANFYRLRWNRAVNRLGTPFAGSTSKLRLTHLYSSSWIIENAGLTWGIDVVEGPFGNYGFAGSITMTEVFAMANKLDALFITHSDSDHLSTSLAVAMLLLGKPVVCSIDLGAVALALGAPPTLIEIPRTGYRGVMTANGLIKYSVYNGKQRMGTPSEIDCNAYSFDTNTGQTIIHGGDVEDPGFAAHIVSANWYADFLLNPSTSYVPRNYQFLSHELEYTHFGSALLKLNMPTVGPCPPNRFVLIWGEAVEF